MSESPPRLPQELVDHILDHLHDDPRALATCALVSPLWLPTSRLHLFSKISLKLTPAAAPSELCKRLLRLLTSSPSITPYIRELEVLEGSPLGGDAVPGPQAASAASRSHWVTTERTFPPLLRLLTHLRRLEFGAQSTTLHWAVLPPPLQHALHAMFALPSLTFVRLKSWSFAHLRDLAALLACCRNLQGLALACVCIAGDLGDVPRALAAAGNAPTGPFAAEEEEESESTPPPRQCRLEFLTIEHVGSGPLGNWLLSPHSPVDLFGLRELRIAHFDDVAAIERLLECTGGSLEYFHFKTGILEVYPFDLSINTNLRSLKLTLEDPLLALPWVHTLLSSITSPLNTLEYLGLEFFTDLKQMADSDAGWAELDALLLRPELAGLRQVEIGLFTLPTSVEFARVREALAGLRARGGLRMYRLGLKNQRSSSQKLVMPRISRYEAS